MSESLVGAPRRRHLVPSEHRPHSRLRRRFPRVLLRHGAGERDRPQDPAAPTPAPGRPGDPRHHHAGLCRSRVRPPGRPDPLRPQAAEHPGGPPSPASDVYSLGVILFEAVTGRLPFPGEDASALAEQHLRAAPPSPRSVNPAIPLALDQVILKVLSKEPAARYSPADQLGRVLSGLTSPSEGPSLPAAFPALPATHPEASTTALAATTAEGLDWLANGLGLLGFFAGGGLRALWLWGRLRYPACPLTWFLDWSSGEW